MSLNYQLLDTRPTLSYNELHEQQNGKTQFATDSRTSKDPRSADVGLSAKEQGRGNRYSDRGRSQSEKYQKVTPHIFEQGQAMKAPAQA